MSPETLARIVWHVVMAVMLGCAALGLECLIFTPAWRAGLFALGVGLVGAGVMWFVYPDRMGL